LVHVATTDPLCAWRHPDLVALSIIADRCPGGVRAVKEIVAWERRIITARVPCAVVNRVVPVEIVVGVLSVPAAIMRLERVMRPAHPGIGTRNNDVLPGEPERPDLGRVRVIDPRFDCGRGLRPRLFHWSRLRKVVMDLRIAFYSCHVRAGRQGFG
jgi:hypothetical protein